MRVLLVNPPQDNIIRTELPWFIGADSGIFPPLGLMYLASYLNKYNSGCEVRILDCPAEGKVNRQALEDIFSFRPDIVGISAYTQNLLDVINLVNDIKKINQSIHISLGGPHSTVFPEAAVSIGGVDSVVIGEGEEIFSSLIDCLCRKGALKEVKGIVVKEMGKPYYTGVHTPSNELDKLPFPDRREISLHNYSYVLGRDLGLMTTMISSRGCKEHCVFCSTPRSGLRIRSAANIADEMEEVVKSNIKEVHFVDDTFNADSGHAMAICNEIMRRNLHLRWGIRARADKLNRELLALLKKSGCYRINIGVETSSDEGLKMLGKGITVSQIREAFSVAKEFGLMTVAYFMLGCPHEKTKADIARTIDFAIELAPDYAMFNLLTLYPGTQLYRDGVKKGILKEDYWQGFAKNPHKDFCAPCWDEWLGRDQLQAMLVTAYRKFYFRPKFIMNAFRNNCRPKVIFQKAKVGINILRA